MWTLTYTYHEVTGVEFAAAIASVSEKNWWVTVWEGTCAEEENGYQTDVYACSGVVVTRSVLRR